MKLQEATKRETLHIASGVLLLVAVENGVYALLHRWTTAVLLGSLMGTLAAVGNFFFLALTVQKIAGEAGEERRGKQWMQLSHSLRTLFMGAVVVCAFLLPGVDGIAAAVCLFFPQPVILVLQAMNRKNANQPKEGEEVD